MKKGYFIVYVFTLLWAVVVVSCKADDPAGPTEQELTFEKLSGEWTLGTNGSIMLDGQDASLNYPNFSLSFTDGSYTTTNAGELFRATGTWEWTDESAINLITVDNGKEVAIQALTENSFTFSFNQSDGGARAGIEGNYIITLVK